MNETAGESQFTHPPYGPNVPYISAEMEGIGGAIRQQCEDFEVDEIPAYLPCGDGAHLLLWIEKRDVSAEQLTKHLAETLPISRNDIGMAGLKDRRAVTRQYVSVPESCSERLGQIETDSVRLLSWDRHRNKLRRGHLRGNRFCILLRDVASNAGDQARRIAETLRAGGFPNYFGPQRFGRDEETVTLGFQLLRGEKQPADLPRSRRKFLLRLSLSAAQAALFNEVVAWRVTEGELNRVRPGDLMQVVSSGGLFPVEDPAVEQRRLDNGEIVPTGPLFGVKMPQPRGEAHRREQQILEAYGIGGENFRPFKKVSPGTRRACLIRPEELEIEHEEAGLRFRFTLPPGAYATVLLREFVKQGDLR